MRMRTLRLRQTRQLLGSSSNMAGAQQLCVNALESGHNNIGSYRASTRWHPHLQPTICSRGFGKPGVLGERPVVRARCNAGSHAFGAANVAIRPQDGLAGGPF